MAKDSDAFEIEHGHADYSDAELLEQAQANAQALMIAIAAFLHERGIAVEAWTDAVGRTFARGWGEPRPWDAGEFMDAMLTNLRSFGADVVSVTLGADRAEAVSTGFPNPELCAVLGVDVALAARFNDVAVAIARDRGLIWTWQLDGERARYVAERTGESGDGVGDRRSSSRA